VIACSHLIPLLIVRTTERVLDVLLPSFAPVSRVLRPLTALLVGSPHPGVIGQGTVPEDDEEQGEAARGLRRAGAQEGLIRGRAPPDPVNRRVRRHARARGHDPAPGHRAIRAEATLGTCADCCGAGVLARAV
jgi:hypothetical protein